MPGVFTLGDAASDTLKEISDKKLKLEEIKKLGIGYGNEISKQEEALKLEANTFRDAAWSDLLKNYESYFSKSAIGAGTKDNFLSKLTQAYETKYDSSLSLEELKKQAALMFGTLPIRQEIINSLVELDL